MNKRSLVKIPKVRSRNTQELLVRGDSSQHFVALDGLRGVAALAVALNHSAGVYTDTAGTTPIPAIFFPITHAGHPSVVMFFVLSGFVLYLAFNRAPNVTYFAYLTRRVFRLFPALLFALLLAVTLHALQNPQKVAEFGPWVTDNWIYKIDLGLVFCNLSLIGVSPADGKLDPVIWSLCVELRFSIVFLFLANLAKRSWLAIAALTATSFATAEVLLRALPPMHTPYQIAGSWTGTLALTLYYLPSFCLGIMTCKIIATQKKPYPKWQIGAAAIAIMLLYRATHQDTVLALAFAAVIYTACLPGVVQNVLKSPPARYLGSISYSLYLVHFPIVMFMSYQFHSSMPIALTVVVAPLLSIVTAHVMHRFIELPGISLGKTLAKRVTQLRRGTIAA